jgi:hypothetical protein
VQYPCIKIIKMQWTSYFFPMGLGSEHWLCSKHCINRWAIRILFLKELITSLIYNPLQVPRTSSFRWIVCWSLTYRSFPRSQWSWMASLWELKLPGKIWCHARHSTSAICSELCGILRSSLLLCTRSSRRFAGSCWWILPIALPLWFWQKGIESETESQNAQIFFGIL